MKLVILFLFGILLLNTFNTSSLLNQNKRVYYDEDFLNSIIDKNSTNNIAYTNQSSKDLTYNTNSTITYKKINNESISNQPHEEVYKIVNKFTDQINSEAKSYDSVNLNTKNDKTEELPIFIETKMTKLGKKSKFNTNEKLTEKVEKNENNELNLYLSENSKQSEEEVIKTFISQFQNSKDIDDYSKLLESGISRLDKEQKELNDAILIHENNINEFYSLTNLLSKIMDKYEMKAEVDSSGMPMRLADEITLKEILKQKIAKELQGLRVNPHDFAELKDVNPIQVNYITKQIIEKLGYFN